MCLFYLISGQKRAQIIVLFRFARLDCVFYKDPLKVAQTGAVRTSRAETDWIRHNTTSLT